MSFVAVMDIQGLTSEEYDAIIAKMGVERQPAEGIYLHAATSIEGGVRVVELWDTKEGFEQYVEDQLVPTSAALGIERPTTVSITPLYNLFAPRHAELLHMTKIKK